MPGTSTLGALANGGACPLFRNKTPRPTKERIAASEKTVWPTFVIDGGAGRVDICFELMKKSFLFRLTFGSVLTSFTIFAVEASWVVKYGWSQKASE